jgi:hypothetical protein
LFPVCGQEGQEGFFLREMGKPVALIVGKTFLGTIWANVATIARFIFNWQEALSAGAFWHFFCGI